MIHEILTDPNRLEIKLEGGATDGSTIHFTEKYLTESFQLDELDELTFEGKVENIMQNPVFFETLEDSIQAQFKTKSEFEVDYHKHLGNGFLIKRDTDQRWPIFFNGSIKRNKLWTEDYRSKSIKGFVFQNKTDERQILQWVESKNIPNLLLIGGSGLGKTTLARILIDELDIFYQDVLELNGSKENSVDVMREKIYNFASAMPFGEIRVIFLDEGDMLSLAAQAVLRNLTETYSDSCRFIISANYGHRIIPAIKSRFQEIEFKALDKNQFYSRILTILENEAIQIDESNIETLNTLVEASLPDLRKCINLLQQNCDQKNNKLLEISQNTSSASSQDYMVKVVQLFKERKINEARKFLINRIRTDEYEEFYRFMYRNLEYFGDTESKVNQAIIIIARGLRDHMISADAEINLSATLAQLAELARN